MSAPGSPQRGILDTTVFIAHESGRDLDYTRLPVESAVSVITIAELHAGVLAATNTATRARRLATLDTTADMMVLPIDEVVAARWAALRVHLAEEQLRLNVNDLWIAATAVVRELPVVTQDADFDPLDGIDGVELVRV